jgi:hypothetical protein
MDLLRALNSAPLNHSTWGLRNTSQLIDESNLQIKRQSHCPINESSGPSNLRRCDATSDVFNRDIQEIGGQWAVKVSSPLARSAFWPVRFSAERTIFWYTWTEVKA